VLKLNQKVKRVRLNQKKLKNCRGGLECRHFTAMALYCLFPRSLVLSLQVQHTTDCRHSLSSARNHTGSRHKKCTSQGTLYSWRDLSALPPLCTLNTSQQLETWNHTDPRHIKRTSQGTIYSWREPSSLSTSQQREQPSQCSHSQQQ
jgi:hypothetical protein